MSTKNKMPVYLLSLGATFLSAGLLCAQSTIIQINNGDVAGLITAITTLNGGSGGFIELAQSGQYVVTAPSDWWYGPNAFPAIQSNIYIGGNGATISRQSGSPNFRFFYVSGGLSTIPAGTLTLENLTLQGGLAQGGSGGSGSGAGGGGGGFGGAIYSQGTLYLNSVAFSQNQALGGSGGGGQSVNSGGAAGGGGMGGNGGSANAYVVSNAAGGGGFKTNGLQECCFSGGYNPPSGGNFIGSEGGSGGTGGTSIFGGNGASGGPQFQGGGGGGYAPGQNGGAGACNYSGAGGGGAFGAGNGGNGYAQAACMYGGGGGGAFGGGGEGNGGDYGGAGGGGIGGGGGGGWNQSGSGGFGGGGGGGYQGGNGGFGGGGGGSYNANNVGYPGFGGGIGGSSFNGASGGGGAGMGGAIFNQLGKVVVTSSSFLSNSANGGAGNGVAQGLGGAIFDLNGSVDLISVTSTGNTTADSNGSAGSGNVVYVVSSYGGDTASGQTPAASLTQSNTNLTGADLVVNQSNGSATSQTGSLPGVVLQPAVLSCPTAILNSSSSCNVTISNVGSAELSATFNVLSGSDFSVLNASACASIAAQSSCTLTIQFTPAAGGSANGAVEITSNAPDSPEVLFVSGTGVAPPSSFTLSSTPNPSEYGASVTLTATVSPSSATGLVTFYDGVTILGDAPVSDGVATLITGLLSSGARSLTALYEGGGSMPYAPIVSAVQVQTVNALAANTLVPTSPISMGTTFGAFFTVVNDFNGDGYQDLAMIYVAGGEVIILLGNGSGGFTPASGSPYTVGGNPYSIVSADFNNDGIPDLAIASLADSNVTVLLGNGDGTFTPASGSPFGVGIYPFGMAVGDFNGDGNADLAIPSGTFNNVTVLLGNGSGGFTAAPGSPITVGNAPFLVAVADFNGDGNADIAVIGQDQNVVVLLGNGQGGFTTAANPASVGDYPYAVATADFNGDGKADLAVADYFGNTVTVLLGNGAGGFTPSPGSPFPVPPTPYSLAVGDFNGDGHPDLAVATENNTVTILLGNGSGGFTSPYYSPLAPSWGAYSVAVGQFNGDGHTDLAVAGFDYFQIYQGEAIPQLQITQQPSGGTVGAAFGNVVVDVNDASGNLMTGSTAQVTLSSNPAGLGGNGTVNASGGIATFNGLVFSAAGSFVLTASSPGTVSSPAGSTIQIAVGSQTITFGPIPSQTMGTPVALNATASSGLTVNFASLTGTVCTVSGNTATLLKIGKCKIQATQPGNANYLAATPVDQSFEVTQGSQTITFNPLSNEPYGTAPFTLTATASSGLTVKYASTTTTVCTVSGATVTLLKVGKCTVRASQAGNANWAAATPVTESFQVSKDSQTITFGSLPNVPLSTGSITVGATASSGLDVTFSSTTARVCTVSGTKVTLIKTGTCTIKATQPGNADYAAAAPVDQSFQVTASNP